MMHSKKKKGFTLIEILVVVAIIAILATAIMVSIGESRRKARINSTMTSLRSALPAIIACNDSSGEIDFSSGEDKDICKDNKVPGAKWPKLLAGYAYAGVGDYTRDCNFEITTNGDRAANIVCDCVKQTCN